MHNPGLYLMAFLYIIAGASHFRVPGWYKSIMPRWLPWHSEIVFVSGLIELMLGVLLLIPATRVVAAWGVILLLIVVFPANIQMTMNYLRDKNPSTWITVIRLPLQILLLWWAYQYTKG